MSRLRDIPGFIWVLIAFCAAFLTLETLAIALVPKPPAMEQPL